VQGAASDLLRSNRDENKMKACDHIRDQIAFYLDDELSGREQAAFEAHIQACAACRQTLDNERQVLESIRAARPLYAAPPALRARIDETLGRAPVSYAASPALRRRIQHFLAPSAAALHLWGGRRLVALAACLCVITFAGVWYVIGRNPRTPRAPLSDFALIAVDAHLRYLRGQLPLEISSASPEKISAWFGGKVPFSLTLPNYQESSGQEKLYQLEGARLVGFNNDYAAYVAYKMRQRQITLVATSNTLATPSGGEEIVSKGLKFHYDSIKGLKVITWSDRGLTYALVSDLEERGQQSCMVCHAGTKDREFIESLKPAR
jgi:anti-sigma factor (TIGR02949 family)